jgi:DNA-binding NarL/FixJ family response regulator
MYGEWLRRRRRRTHARAQLRQAAEMFRAMGATAFLERAQRELRATGATRGGAEGTGRLTARELQVAGLARCGLSNPQIAARLFLSPRTVEYHLRNVFTKLGISSRHELAATPLTTAPAR